ELAIDAAVALFEAGRIPGEVKVNEVSAIGLQIYSLARGIRTDQYRQRFNGRFGVKGPLNLLAAIQAGRAGEHPDSLLSAVGIGERFAKAALQPAPRILPFREDDQPPARPQ